MRTEDSMETQEEAAEATEDTLGEEGAEEEAPTGASNQDSIRTNNVFH
jgi:hypothetical protein